MVSEEQRRSSSIFQCPSCAGAGAVSTSGKGASPPDLGPAILRSEFAIDIRGVVKSGIGISARSSPSRLIILKNNR
jgi:hypothetical protein